MCWRRACICEKFFVKSCIYPIKFYEIILLLSIAAPEGLAPPTVVLITRGYSFSWLPPTRPNGIITRYTLFLGSSAIYNSSHDDSVNITGAVVTSSQTYHLEAHNSAGSVVSETRTLDPIPEIGTSKATLVGFTIGEAIGVIVAVATVIVVLLLLVMVAVSVTRSRKTEKQPSFLSHNFKVEQAGVVRLLVMYMHTCRFE